MGVYARRHRNSGTICVLGAEPIQSVPPVGLLSVISFNVGANLLPAFMETHLKSPSYFDLLDNLASNFLMPVGAILMSLFVGWSGQ